MRSTAAALVALVLSLAVASPARAAGDVVMIESIAGGAFFATGIGDGGAPGDTFRNVLEQRWTQHGDYRGVRIYAGVYAVTGSTGAFGGTAYLTDAIGADPIAVIASTPFVFPEYASASLGRVSSVADPTLLFSDLDLPAGTYHLVIAADAPVEAQWTTIAAAELVGAIDVEATPNVVFFSNGTTGGQNFAFPPASSFLSFGGDTLAFRILGRPVPEPTGCAAGAAAWIALSAIRRRSRQEAARQRR